VLEGFKSAQRRSELEDEGLRRVRLRGREERVTMTVYWGLGTDLKDMEAHSWSHRNIHLNAYFFASRECQEEERRMSQT